MFMIFVILLELIGFFNGMFPSFNLHFLTFSKSKDDLIILLFLIFIILFGFTTWAHIISGSSYPDFKSFSSTLLYLFHYVIIFSIYFAKVLI